MKELMRKGFSFLSFDLYELNVQRQSDSNNTELSFYTYRWFLIYHYWFRKVPLHFASLTLMAWLSLAIINPTNLASPSVIIFSAVEAFLLQILFLYLPLFIGLFLPEMHKTLQAENIDRSLKLEKCKKAQLPNTTLVLIWYALDKTSGINSVKNDNMYTELLTQLYGVDQRSIKSTIDLFWGSAQKRNNLRGRARTEIENRFSEAYQFFEVLHSDKAIKILKDLELKCFSK